MRSVNIFDPGMSGYAGHHADINFRVAREFQKLGFKVVIYAHKDFPVKENSVEVRTVFPLSPYATIPSYHLGFPGQQGKSVFEVSTQVIRQQLEAADNSDISLFPTLFPCQASAVGLVQRGLGRVIGVMHNAPAWKNKFGEFFWRQGLRAIASYGDERRLGVLEGELLLEYERLLEIDGLEIHQFPIPHDGSPLNTRGDRPFTVGILGHQRDTKGVSHLPLVVGALRNAGFYVILQDSSGQVQATEIDQSVRVLGYVDDLASVIAECDVVLLNYDLDMYRYNGSGICWECVATGIPIVIPKGSSMSRYIRSYGAGLRFVSGDMNSLISRLREISVAYESFVTRSKIASEIYRRVNSTASFVRDCCTKPL